MLRLCYRVARRLFFKVSLDSVEDWLTLIPKEVFAMRGMSLILMLVCLSGLMPGPRAFAWDGDWTQGRSGEGTAPYDKGGSQGDAGTPERPQTFFTPPTREFVDVDPEELKDYGRKEVSPYALARIQQTIRYQGLTIPKGYYLIKPGDERDGSPKINLNTMAAQSGSLAPLAASGQTAGAAAGQSSTAGAGPASSPGSTVGGGKSAHRVFVIKQLGKVVAVVPIHRMERYNPKRKENIPRTALAWVEIEDRHPVLKFYYRHRVYSTDFQ